VRKKLSKKLKREFLVAEVPYRLVAAAAIPPNAFAARWVQDKPWKVQIRQSWQDKIRPGGERFGTWIDVHRDYAGGLSVRAVRIRRFDGRE
jgi:hypothetical protein